MKEDGFANQSAIVFTFTISSASLSLQCVFLGNSDLSAVLGCPGPPANAPSELRKTLLCAPNQTARTHRLFASSVRRCLFKSNTDMPVWPQRSNRLRAARALHRGERIACNEEYDGGGGRRRSALAVAELLLQVGQGGQRHSRTEGGEKGDTQPHQSKQSGSHLPVPFARRTSC